MLGQVADVAQSLVVVIVERDLDDVAVGNPLLPQVLAKQVEHEEALAAAPDPGDDLDLAVSHPVDELPKIPVAPYEHIVLRKLAYYYIELRKSLYTRSLEAPIGRLFGICASRRHPDQVLLQARPLFERLLVAGLVGLRDRHRFRRLGPAGADGGVRYVNGPTGNTLGAVYDSHRVGEDILGDAVVDNPVIPGKAIAAYGQLSLIGIFSALRRKLASRRDSWPRRSKKASHITD